MRSITACYNKEFDLIRADSFYVKRSTFNKRQSSSADQEDNESAWENFCDIYGPVVYAWARKRGLQASDATDVTQSTFQSVAEKIGGFEPGRFRSWLWTVFRSRLMDHFRAKNSEPVANGGSDARDLIEAIPAEPASEESDEGRQEIRQVYNRVLEVVGKTINPDHWQAFVRVTVNGDAPADVAEDLGISVWTVYKCQARVLQRVNRELEGLEVQIALKQ